MVLELHVVRVGLGQLLEALYSGLHARLPEQPHVVEGVVFEPPEARQDERRQRRAVLLDVGDQRDAKNRLIWNVDNRETCSRTCPASPRVLMSIMF